MIEPYYPLAFRGDPEADAVSLFPSALRLDAGWAAILGAWATETAALDVALYTALIDGSLDNATGDRLRQYGDLVGEPGAGLSEEDHRRLIAGRIAATRSDGGREGFASTWRALGGELSRALDSYPAGVVAWTTLPDYLSPTMATRTARIARDALPAGVGSDLVVIVATGFLFSEDLTGPPSFDGPALAQVL